MWFARNYQWRTVRDGRQNPALEVAREPLKEMVVQNSPELFSDILLPRFLTDRVTRLHRRSRTIYLIGGMYRRHDIDTWFLFHVRGQNPHKLFLDLQPGQSKWSDNVTEQDIVDIFTHLRVNFGCSHFRFVGRDFANFQHREILSQGWRTAGFRLQYVNGQLFNWGDRRGISDVVVYVSEEDLPDAMKPVSPADQHYFYQKRMLDGKLAQLGWKDGDVARLGPNDPLLGARPREVADGLWRLFSKYFVFMRDMYRELPCGLFYSQFLEDLPFERESGVEHQEELRAAFLRAEAEAMRFFARMPSKYPVLFAWCTLARLRQMLQLVNV